MAKVFIVGATGHVGGAVLDLLQNEHPGVQVRVQVRSEDKASRLQSKYPRVQPVVGDLDSHSGLEAGAREADIVINAAPDITHDEGIKAILKGLTAPDRDRTGYYIHTSGAACIYEEPELGKEARIWDDIEDIDELISMDPMKTHLVTDNLVRDASPKVHVAIISPPGIAGVSPSLEHPFPLSTGPILLTARAFNSGFEVSHGVNYLAQVDVVDLARAYLVLIANALDALASGAGVPAEPAGFPLWGPKAYYFVVGQTLTWHERMIQLARILHKLGAIDSAEIKNVTQLDLVRILVSGGKEPEVDAPLPRADSWALHLAVGLSSHMRVCSSRLARLGWRPERLTNTDEGLEQVFGGYLGLEKEQSSVLY